MVFFLRDNHFQNLRKEQEKENDKFIQEQDKINWEKDNVNEKETDDWTISSFSFGAQIAEIFCAT